MKKKKKKRLIIILLLIIVIAIVFVDYVIYMAPKFEFESKEVTISTTEEYDEYNFQAYSGKENIKDKVSIENNIEQDKLGTYKVKYSYKTLFGNVSEEVTVNVVDKQEPIIELDGDEEIELCRVDDFEEPGYRAYDNIDGDISDKVQVTKTDKFIYYSVTDSSNNIAEKGRIIKEKDDIAPKISLNGSANISVRINGEYKEQGATATDNCDGNISDKIKISGSVNTSKTGNYKITYEVTDKKGNKSSVSRTVSVFSPEANNAVIYLTFDDGPGAYTTKILDILDKYNVKATFFVTNNGSNSIILDEYKRGHTVALHTATHNWNIYNSPEAYFNDLYTVYNRVKNITGQDSKYIRFPGGSSNTVSKSHATGIMTKLASMVQEKGFRYYDWNVCVEDAGACASSSVSDKSACVLKYFKNGISTTKANVVLLHDIKSYTANALEDMIKYALDRGYTFKAIDDNTPEIHQNIRN